MALDKLTKVQSVGISSFIQVVGVVTATGGFVGDLTGNVTGNITGTTSNASGATGDFSIADKIVHTGDTNTALRFPAADTITAETGGSERFKVTDSLKEVKNGNLRITSTYIDFGGDISTPATAAAIFRPADNTLAFSTGNNERLRITSSGVTVTGSATVTEGLVLDGQNGSGKGLRLDLAGSGDYVIQETSTDDIVQFGGTGSSNFFTHNISSGNIGIGTDSPNGLLALTAASGRLLTLRNSTTGFASGDGSYLALNGSDFQIANAESANVILYTADTERLRITSDGKMGVGTASPNHKLTLHNSGTGTFDALNITSGLTNAVGLQFGIDSASNVFFWHTANGGIKFATNNVERARVTNNGITFNGDTAAANALDDYEEGTWTPTITGLGNHNNNAGSTWGKYTKIGNRVFITWRYSWTSRNTTNGGVVFLGSLPFSAPNDSKSDAVYIGGLEGIISNTGREVYGGQVVYNTNTIQFRASGHNVSENSLFGSLSTSMSSGYIYGGANYIVG